MAPPPELFRSPRNLVGRVEGLLGLWRARRGWVCRHEQQRLDAGRSAFARRAPVVLVGILYAGAAAWALFTGNLAGGFVQSAIALGVLVGACVAGVRAFGGEREADTLAALVMAPAARYDLVVGRLFARLRPYFILCLLFLSIWALCFAIEASSASQRSLSWSPNLWRPYLWHPRVLWHHSLKVAFLFGGIWQWYYLSILLLGASEGLGMGLRARSTGRALLATLAALFILLTLEGAVLFAVERTLGPAASPLLMVVASWTPLTPGQCGWLVCDIHIKKSGMSFLVVLFSAIHLFLAGRLINGAAKRFDRWAADP